MGSEPDSELSSIPKLQLFSVPVTVQSPERSGTVTPPLHTSATVPFRWEEEPGKPKPCTALTTFTNTNSEDYFAHKCSELPVPPRLLLTEGDFTKLSSPTTVLDGPYVGKSSRFATSSFRMGGECYGSFRKSLSPERDDQTGLSGGAMVVCRRSRCKEKGLFGNLRRKGKREVVGRGSYVFPSSVDREMMSEEWSGEGEGEAGNRGVSDKITKITRGGSFRVAKSSYFWATVYEGLKQVVPWKSRKAKKDGLLG